MRTVLILLTRCAIYLTPTLFAQNSCQALHELFEAEWERKLKENPTYASQLGDKRYAHQWPDVSLRATEKSIQQQRQALRKAQAFAVDECALLSARR